MSPMRMSSPHEHGRVHLAWLIGLSLSVGCDGAPVKSESSSGPTTVDAEDSAEPDSDVTDADGDGHPVPDDCNESDATIHPGAAETCNGLDDNCDGTIDEGVQTTFYVDGDGDGHGSPDSPVEACELTDGLVLNNTDCDDSEEAVHPGVLDVCNGIDDDCDALLDEDGDAVLYADTDGDGWGDEDIQSSGCPEEGWALDSGDCDDSDPSSNPGVSTDFCDGTDNDCDGDIDEDSKPGWSLMSVNTTDGNVYDIDTTTATVTSISPVSTDFRINSMDVGENGVAFVHISSEKEIGIFDPCTGTATSLGAHGAGSIGGISFGPAGRLFGIGGGADTLWEFDLSTGAATAIGPLGIDIGSSGMAWDCSTQTMYGADTTEDIVFEIDLTTGEARNIQPTDVPFSSVGLEYDRVSGLLFASSGTVFYTVDPTSGHTTQVGSFGVTNMDDLARHPACP